MSTSNAYNVFGEPLLPCCMAPATGFMRDGFCHHHSHDRGKHLLCAQVTADFLQFSLQQGNDLITPRLQYQFPGLKPGDRWCLCVDRWLEALQADVAPPLFLARCHQDVLNTIPLDTLHAHAVIEESVHP